MKRAVAWCLVLCLGWMSLAVRAQERDPTRAPPEMAAAEAGNPAPQPWGADGMAVVVRDGKPYLVVDTRLYAVGQTIGSSRITRITESEVWLREGKTLRKLARFAGIQRAEVATTPMAPASATVSQRGKASTTLKKATAP